MSKVQSLNKRYTKDKSICNVTFRLPKDAVVNAKRVNLVGDFNNWDKNALKMTVLKNGSAKIVLPLKSGQEYRFRYLINGFKWENDWSADRYETSPMAWEDNSIVKV